MEEISQSGAALTLPALVLDCSVAMSWFLPGETGARAQEIRRRVTDEGAVVPSLWPIEIANVFLFAVRARRISPEQRGIAFGSLGELPIEIDADTLTKIWTKTLALADGLRLTIYDACYLELAQRSGLPLASEDKDLRAAARKLKIALL